MSDDTSGPGEAQGALSGGQPMDGPTGPPPAFGRGVNDYYNHYIGVADAKAGGFLTAALTVGAAVLTLKPAGTLAQVLYWLAVVALGGSGVAGGAVVFPRLPLPRHRGLIFWEDVRIWPSVADYQHALANASEQDVELEYAAQNIAVSKVLHDKHVWVRIEIGLFMLGAAAGLAAFITIRHA